LLKKSKKCGCCCCCIEKKAGSFKEFSLAIHLHTQSNKVSTAVTYSEKDASKIFHSFVEVKLAPKSSQRKQDTCTKKRQNQRREL
jgi:hypothetical protein